MNEIKLEDIERMVGKLVIANFYNEQNLVNQLEQMQAQIQQLQTQMAATGNREDGPVREVRT
jgi:hypothetical protein